MNIMITKPESQDIVGKISLLFGGAPRSLAIIAQPPGLPSPTSTEKGTLLAALKSARHACGVGTVSMKGTCGVSYGFNVSYVCSIGVV